MQRWTALYGHASAQLRRHADASATSRTAACAFQTWSRTLATNAAGATQALAQPASKKLLWFQEDRDGELDAKAATKRMAEALRDSSLVGERHLREVMKRVKQPCDASAAVDAVERFRGARALQGRNSPFRRLTCSQFVRRLVAVGEAGTALAALQRGGALGLERTGRGAWVALIVALAKNDGVEDALKAYEAMKALGIRPNRRVADKLVLAALHAGRLVVAQALLAEFVANGVPPYRMVSEMVANGPGLSNPLATPDAAPPPDDAAPT